MKSAFQAIAVFALFYMTLLGAMYVFQRKLLYIPSKIRPELRGLSAVYSEIQTQTEDQLTLTHWYARRGPLHIVVLHGNAGNIEGRGYKFKFLADEGYSVLLVSYRGYGGNPGRPTEKNVISDSAQVLEWLMKHEEVSPENMILIGESLGSGAAVALAARYPVKGLILDGAYSSITDVAGSVYPLIPVRLLLKDTWDSQSRIQQVKAPVLFIHSRKDPVLPFRFAQKLFQATGEPKKEIWLNYSGHTDNLQTKAVKKAVVDFIQSLL